MIGRNRPSERGSRSVPSRPHEFVGGLFKRPGGVSRQRTSPSFQATSSIAAAIFLRRLHQLAVEGGADVQATTLSAPASRPARCRSALGLAGEDDLRGGVEVRGRDDPSAEACRQSSLRWSARRPMIAAMVPGRSYCAAAISVPRWLTRRIPSSAPAPRRRPRPCIRRGCGRPQSRPDPAPRATSSRRVRVRRAPAGRRRSVSDSIGPARRTPVIGSPETSSA